MKTVEEAGAIVVRSDGREPLILLVTARRNPDDWIFPKGHLEDDETLEEAAVREAREEGGVEGTVLGGAGSSSFTLGKDRYRVRYFVLATRDEGAPEEGRRLAWLPFDRALAWLTFEDTRRLLRNARPLVLEAARYVSPAPGTSDRK